MGKPPPDPLFVLRGHTAHVTALHFPSKDFDFTHGRALISGSQKGEIFIWDLKINRIQFKLHGHGGKTVLWLCDFKNCVLSQGKDDVISIWKYHDSEWTVNRKIPAHNAGFCSAKLLDCNSQRCIIVSSIDMNSLNLLDYNTGDLLSEVKPPVHGMCMCLKVCNKGNEMVIVCGYEDGTVLAWSMESNSVISSISCHSDAVFCLDVDLAHQRRGVSGSADDALKTWHVDDNFQFSMGKQITLRSSGVNCISIRPDGKIVVIGCWVGCLRVFGWKSLIPLAVLNFHKDSILCLQFCIGFSDNYESVIASGGKDSNIVLWSIY